MFEQTEDSFCPTCNAPEKHPYDSNSILVRGYKFTDEHGHWSQCLVCSGFYNPDTLEPNAENHNRGKGWFVE